MREQSKWRRVLAAVLIGAGLALVGVGVVSASTNDGVWVADGVWVGAAATDTGTTSFTPSDGVWVQ